MTADTRWAFFISCKMKDLFENILLYKWSNQPHINIKDFFEDFFFSNVRVHLCFI